MKKQTEIRKIIHVDMDAFFAAVYIRDHPEVKGKPVICGGPANSRGVVSTCNYEARKYGIHSAMPSFQAHKLCPHGIFVRPDFNRIREAAEIVREIFYEYTDLVEPVSIDEAYLDVTENKMNTESATEIAREIRKQIFEKIKLTASAGVSYNKFLAKIASDMDKPDGLTVITPKQAMRVLEELPIGKFHGIGKATEKRMNYLGIRNGKDLKERTLKELVKHFGKVANFYYYIVRGIDNRKVTTSRIRKSLGCERTFAKDITDVEEMLNILKTISQKISGKMQEKKFKAKTLTVKIKYANFDVVSRSKTFELPFDDDKLMLQVGRKLLLETLGPKCSIRLLGLSVSNLVWLHDQQNKQQVLPFFAETELVVGD
ncbi:MAG: DNA polymerase IV [Candidatus Cloacimonetes bacterium]|nr:DNA polymerase IV [Candidatus Cloacimonadota bacterium]MCF7813632.1 DNA polymerase IV [Candidatus Cloacimonadota bacterium]MCF7868311.1 DNA polymerase IV [Candidatus Cloacimonadota bacterium]MCF7883786.1 DNA polymerase IV [Candidatus Cloacimonadota bacterium]